MKRIFGFMCTLDPLGFTDSQLFTIPFMVLHRAFTDMMNEPTSEKRKQIYKYVLQTCQNVFNNVPDQIKIIQEIIKNPLKRTDQEANPSIPLLFAKILCFLEENPQAFSQQELEELFFVIIEEIDRRSYGKEDEPKNNKQLMQYAFPNLKKEVENFFFLEFAAGEGFDKNTISDLINQFSTLGLEEVKEESKEVILPFGLKQ